MFNVYKMKNRSEGGSSEQSKQSTGHDRFCQVRVTNRPKNRAKRKATVRRTNSANEFDPTALSAASRRELFSRNRSVSSDHDHSDQSEHSEKSPLVSARLDSLARLFFSRSLPTDTTSSRDTIESVLTTRPNVKYQYSALDSGTGVQERSPRERAIRERAFNATQEWITKSNGRYDVIAQLDEIGSRHTKNWFLISDATVRTDRLMTLLPLPRDCIALDELPPSCESPKEVLMELLSSLHHPYIYPTLDLGFIQSDSINYACLVTPFNARGSLKDLIYKSQWNEPWNRKYTRKPQYLPISQIQRLGRQILEALLFLKERGFPLHGHLHSGNVILQNGVARLAGLENSLLGLSSRINAIMWSRSTSDIENIDIICFGHLLYEMCTGQEMTTPKPSIRVLEMDLDRFPQILEIMLLIFDPPDGICPTVEELVLCDLFRSIDLRELRGACTIKPSLSRSTLNLLHAVRKRQISSLGRSLSATSSPCTPPTTPHRRAGGTMDSFDMSSDSEGILDEVVVTSTCCYGSPSKQQQNQSHSSPIHFCDKSPQAEEPVATNGTGSSGIGSGNRNFQPLSNITNTILPSTSQTTATSFNNQLTADICNYKNSKSRRLEYSLKCLKYGRSNPSQDSAFGSLTDGDLSIGSSSFRLSSFQSISSPIDEGVEDIIIATGGEISFISGNDSAVSSPCREGSPNFPPHSPKIRYNTTSSSTSNLQFDPPKILVNGDQNTIYTTSPSKRNGTIEVFSQKYRVCSFEDMSPNKKQNLKNANKMAFRSLEEEQRIDNAFIPIKDRTNSENRVNINRDSEKYKKLTHHSFRHNLEPNSPVQHSSGRNSLWKDSRFYRKTKIAKSNDSLLTDSPRSTKLSLLTTKAHSSDNHYEREKNGVFNRNKSANEIATTCINGSDLDYRINSRRSRSERHLFNLVKLKQTAITSDFLSEDENYQPNDNNKSYSPSPTLSVSPTPAMPTPIPTPSPSTSPIRKFKTKIPSSSVTTLSSSSNFKRNTMFKSLDIELNDISRGASICKGKPSNEDVKKVCDDSSTENTPSMSLKDLCNAMKDTEGQESGGDSSGTTSGNCSNSSCSVEEKTPLLDSLEMSPISPNEPEIFM